MRCTSGQCSQGSEVSNSQRNGATPAGASVSRTSTTFTVKSGLSPSGRSGLVRGSELPHQTKLLRYSQPIDNLSIYTATKGAVDAVTRVLAKELGARKIRVNSINPGGVETEGVHTAGIIGSEFANEMVARTPLEMASVAERVSEDLR